MALSEFQKQILTGSQTDELYKKMQQDAMQLKNTIDYLQLRLEKYQKISGADATTHLSIPSEIVVTLSNFRTMLDELLQAYDGAAVTFTNAPVDIVADMYSIVR